MSTTKQFIEERIFFHMKEISQSFIQAEISSMCLYASALLKERLAFEGISMKLVAGYLLTNRGQGEVFRHVWLEHNDTIYDVSIDILKKVAWKSNNIKYKHQKTLSYNLKRTDSNNDQLEYGISLYQRNPFVFWSEFDNCTMPEIHNQIAPVINKLRDSFLD
jgi:hypothetical protein